MAIDGNAFVAGSFSRLHAGDCTEAGEAEGDDESFAHFHFSQICFRESGSRHQFASAPFVCCLVVRLRIDRH
jgi:hypothetical protein